MSLSDHELLSIEASLAELGARLARLRLSRNLTQASLAREAGASVSSIKRLEAGANTSLDTLLRVLRVLGLEQAFATFLPDPQVRPVERVKHRGRERQRARDGGQAAKTSVWAWGDEVDS